MAATFGIHLGNSSACIAMDKDGKCSVLANDAGERVTPAVLSLQREEWIVGKTANKSSITNNKKAVGNDNPAAIPPYVVEDDETEEIITPDEVCSKFLEHLSKIGKQGANNEPEVNVVLATPVHWSNISRKRYKMAAEKAGMNVLHIISEPAAACLAYKLDNTKESFSVLIFRSGGTSSDLSVVNVSKGLFSVEKSIHLAELGGKDFTARLANFLAEEFQRKWKLDPRESKRSVSKLYQYADDCKRILSTMESSQVFIESLCEGIDWSQNITRARFENLIGPEINSCVDSIRKFIQDCSPIKKVILCGGTTKIPKLQTAISSILPDAQFLEGIRSDELIAVGTAKQASMVYPLFDFPIDEVSTEMDCLSTSLHAKYLDSDVCVFPEGCAMVSETFLEMKNPDLIPTLNISLYDKTDPDNIIGVFNFSNVPKDSNVYASLENGQVTMNVM